VTESAFRIALVYPELLGTYGDRGDALILQRRLEWRGLGAEVVSVALGAGVPDSCDLYVLGGGEDGPQSLAASELERSGALGRAVDRGAAVLAVCAGLQVLGRRFAGADGAARDGLGLLDCVTVAGPRRAIGEIVAEPGPAWALPVLTGYENHGGRTTRGPGAAPLGRVTVGCGNGDGSEGVVTGRVVGTYLHGPALARNPALADHLLSSVAGPLEPLDDADVDALRAERLAAARGARRGLPRSIAAWRAARTS
jgi:CobQ-like glutamine amidotransferase family enzyme